MIDELHIRDLALIDEVWLELGPGLTVLSGETGAGKTVMLSALKLLMGERADSSAVRYGAEEALVEARLTRRSPDHEGELVVARRVSAGGRSRCMLDGAMATVSNLEDAVGSAIDLHGQHEHQRLLRPSTHVDYLDAYGGTDIVVAAEEYRTARGAHQAAVAELQRIRETLCRSSEELAVNRLILAEIDRVDPKPNEDEELSSLLPAMQNAELIAKAADGAREVLAGTGGAVDLVGEAVAGLDKVVGHRADLAPLVSSLREALAIVGDVADSLRAPAEPSRYDEAELDRVLARLAALDGLKKRFGPTLDVVLERRAALAGATEVVESGSEALERAEADVASAKRALESSAHELNGVRTRAASAFRAAVLDQAQGLELGSANFEVSIELLPFERWTTVGPSAVEFMYAPAVEIPPRPLAKIASGGEISRVMLALKSVLGSVDADPAETLVFDEIDAGIGGSTATAIGERLARLARTHQVIVVTHLAQVAAFADAHFVVRKVEEAGRTSTIVVPVEGDARVAEIARMLSGEQTDVALEHARALLVTDR